MRKPSFLPSCRWERFRQQNKVMDAGGQQNGPSKGPIRTMLLKERARSEEQALLLGCSCNHSPVRESRVGVFLYWVVPSSSSCLSHPNSKRWGSMLFSTALELPHHYTIKPVNAMGSPELTVCSVLLQTPAQLWALQGNIWCIMC